MSELTPEMRAWMAEDAESRKAELRREKPDDFLDRWLPKASFHLDATPHSGVAPSSLMAIRYCAMMSGGYTVAQVNRCEEEAYGMAERWRIESRRRYREGFHASPLGDPIAREHAGRG